MKKENAFTLAELLAVITILGVIALIVFPAVNKAIKNSKEKSYNQQVESILDSAENWTLENMSQLSDTSDNYITIGELQQSGYLEAKKVINPITDEEMNGCIVIKYDESYNQYTYQYNETSCDDMPVERICDTEILGKNITSGEVVCLDPDMNPRYVGSDPSNYVWFNKDENGDPERWRIIGVFNGQTKIVRDFHSTRTTWDRNGSNNWLTASLQLALNNTTDGYITTIQANDLDSYNYIDLEHVWNIGGYDSTYSTAGIRSAFYTAERSGTSAGAEGSNTTWIGAIGLIYPSDYGYSTNGDEEICNAMYNWSESLNEAAHIECADNSWLHDPSIQHWTITSLSDNFNNVFVVTPVEGVIYDGEVDSYDEGSGAVNPVLYLKSNVKIVGGQGTYDEPYVLGIE